MNKKMLGVFVCLFTLALLTIPVMGAPATKIEGVTTIPLTPAVRMFHSGYPRSYDNGIIHSKGNNTHTVRLTIPGLGLGGSDLILDGSHYSDWSTNYKLTDPDPEAVAVITASVVWTFTGEGTTGTFEGRVYRTITGLPISASSITHTRMILHGTGDFLGQTVKLVDGTGYLIIPK